MLSQRSEAMSRKAKVPDDEKKTWCKPRIDLANLGYNYWKKPNDSLMRNTLVFIDHKQHQERNEYDQHQVWLSLGMIMHSFPLKSLQKQLADPSIQ